MTEADATASGLPDGAAGTHLIISGHVQGVGFRYFVKQTADAAGLAGWVRNRHDTRVEVVLIGAAAEIQTVRDRIGRGPAGARVDEVVARTARVDECEAATRPLTVRTTT